MATRVKVLAAKSDDMSLIPGTQAVEGESHLLRVVLHTGNMIHVGMYMNRHRIELKTYLKPTVSSPSCLLFKASHSLRVCRGLRRDAISPRVNWWNPHSVSV